MISGDIFTQSNNGRKGFSFFMLGRQWLIFGVLAVLLATGCNYLFSYYGILEEISWKIVAFLFFYTLLLFGIFNYFGKDESGGGAGRSWRPNGLARLRSYLTFLPITQIIQHGEGKETHVLRDEQDFTSDQSQLAIRIGVQKDLVIEAILEEYVVPWYSKISSNTLFLSQSRTILQQVFQQVGEKLRRVDRNEIAKEAIQTVHMHWKEYCDAASKSASNGQNIIKCFKFVHPYLQDSTEVAQHYEKMVCQLLEDLVLPELQSSLLCQFLSGILVKSFFLYYIDVISQPAWINNNLIVLLSSASVMAELAGSSQNSSAPATPLPERSPLNTIGDICSELATPTPSSGSGLTPPQSKNTLETSNESNDSRFAFGRKEIQDLALDSKDINKESRVNDSPLSLSRASRGTPSPSTSVSSALSGVIPATAIPLLPSGSYIFNSHKTNYGLMEDASILSVDATSIYNESSQLQNQEDGEEEDCSNTIFSIAMTSETDVKYFGNSEVSTGSSNQEVATILNDNDDANSTTSYKATTPTHYYSFEEISMTKPSHPMLDSATLSVDGATDKKKKAEKSNTHELKIVKDGESKNGRSPVYEEPEDFATSIAKLRSLLEQKESKKNLVANSQETHLSNVDLSNCGETTEINVNVAASEEDGNNSDQGDNVKFCEVDESSVGPEADQVPELKSYFLNISIPKVESYNDSGGQLDFYCIQYEGVYMDEKYEENVSGKVILRTTTVKRRFKEFVSLHSKLEEKSHWKPHLKGIKAPNRWLNLSFSKADAAATRKAMLEKYINQVCSHPVLGTSREVLQFMAYGDEGFSFDPLDINSDPKHLLSTKLDKLAKKFSGVMNSLKDVFPSFESNPPSPHSDSEASKLAKSPSDIDPPFQFSVKPSNIINGDDDDDHAQQVKPLILDTVWLENLVPSIDNCCDESSNKVQGWNTSTLSDVTVNVSDASPDEPLDDNSSNATYPLAGALTQLLCDVLWLPNCRPHNASVSTFMSLSGKSLENYVQETIDVFLSDEAVLGYLEWCRKSLKAEFDLNQDLQYDLSEIDFRNCLRRRIPAWVRWMWGRNRLDLTIERITGFFQNPIINQDLVLSLSELLFTKLTPTQE